MVANLTPLSFVAKWRKNRLKESSASKEHFLDLCHLLSHPTPAEMDPRGEFFTFEAFATKQSGGQGFADVWYKGHFAWEYKGQHANLDKAYQQLDNYRVALQNPPLLIVSDLDQIVIRTNFINTQQRIFTLSLDDLLIPEKLDILRRCFLDPFSLQAPQISEIVTQEAAKKFASLADLLRKAGHAPHEIAHFLIRILFCLFAEDAYLLPSPIFSTLVRNFVNHPQTFTAQLSNLFSAMSTGGGFGAELIPHFDGHLFDNTFVLPLTSEGIQILHEVSTLDWSKIEPSIFGTLFERSLDPSKRSQLGAHYTSSDDILLIIEPVLMMPLRQEWQKVQQEVYTLAEQIPASSGQKRARLVEKATGKLQSFADSIAHISVLDPACGSGNFLYLALRQLLDLQKQVIQLAQELSLPAFFPTVTPAQLHGIEINEYAHQLAQTTIQIGYIQWLREKGFGIPQEPILKPLDNILNMDAILAFDANGKPSEPEWPSVDVVVGNPPFLGGGKLRAELGDTYTDALFELYGDRLPHFSDLVCYWFEKARAMIEQGKLGRAGLLATNSIRGGVNRRVLERIKQSGNIFWAISDKDWLLDGAAVNVSMIGFDNGQKGNFFLDGNMVELINSDLTSHASNLTLARPLKENVGICFRGLSPMAPFDIAEDVAKEMLGKTNPNGRPNLDVIRPVINGMDIVQRNRNMWTIDFPPSLSEEQAAQYESPFEYVKKYVYPIRRKNVIAYRATYWWRYADMGLNYRQALKDKRRYIATPRVSKHRIFAWINPVVLANDGTVVFARDDDYFFGVLQSHLHELWALRLGTTLEDRPRYSQTLTFQTYPFPWPPGKEDQNDPRVQVVAAAARELVQLRDAWLNPPGASDADLKKRTLTNLYNQRPTWLKNVHRKLDQAAFAAYGWSDNLSDEEILEHLLALNLERSNK